jgi:hypothetical protein
MATIAEIREKYPQYSDMPDAALADALHNKFYSDIPKADFYAKIGLSVAPKAGEGMPQERTTMQEIMQAPAGIYRGFKDVTDTLIKGGASAVDYLAGTNARAAVDEAAAQSAREYEKTYGESMLAGGGRLAGNIVASAQPNVTSIGTLTALTVSGITNLGPVANVWITGGTAGLWRDAGAYIYPDNYTQAAITDS